MTAVGTGQAYLDSLSGTKAATTAKTGNKQQLDQSSFLTLLTTQLKTQDPTAPVDNTQMVAQLAQFSSVAGISEMNTTLKGMSADLAASRLGGAASWIGRAALVAGDVATPLSDGGYAGEVTLPADARSVQVTLTDAAGNVVHQQNFGDAKAGALGFRWDGRQANGAAVTGPLAVSVSAFDAKGQAMQPATATWASIAAVESPASGATRLTTPLGAITPAQALRLS